MAAETRKLSAVSDVFLSYSHEDIYVVRLLATAFAAPMPIWCVQGNYCTQCVIKRPQLRANVDPPPLKWSDLRYVSDIEEDGNGKEALQA